MSLPDYLLDPEPDYVECPVHRWVYPLGSICQACRLDIKDEYSDMKIQDKKDGLC